MSTFDASSIPAGVYCFHGKVYFEVLKEPISALKQPPIVESSSKALPLPPNVVHPALTTLPPVGVLKHQAYLCFSYIACYSKRKLKRKASNREILEFVSKTGRIASGDPASTKGLGVSCGNSHVDVADAKVSGYSNREISMVEGLLQIAHNENGKNTHAEKEKPVIVLDPMSDTWEDSAGWCNEKYKLEFRTKQLLIPCGNLFEKALKVVNGDNYCGPLEFLSASGSLKTWNLQVSYTDTKLPYFLLKIIFHECPSTPKPAIAQELRRCRSLETPLEYKFMWAANAVLKSKLSFKKNSGFSSPDDVVLRFVKHHFYSEALTSLNQGSTNFGDSRQLASSPVDAVSKALLISTISFVIDVSVDWPDSIVFRSDAFVKCFGISATPHLYLSIEEFINLALLSKEKKMPMSGSSCCMGLLSDRSVLQFTFSVWGERPPSSLKLENNANLIGVTLKALGPNPHQQMLERKMSESVFSLAANRNSM